MFFGWPSRRATMFLCLNNLNCWKTKSFTLDAARLVKPFVAPVIMSVGRQDRWSRESEDRRVMMGDAAELTNRLRRVILELILDHPIEGKTFRWRCLPFWVHKIVPLWLICQRFQLKTVLTKHTWWKVVDTDRCQANIPRICIVSLWQERSNAWATSRFINESFYLFRSLEGFRSIRFPFKFLFIVRSGWSAEMKERLCSLNI